MKLTEKKLKDILTERAEEFNVSRDLLWCCLNAISMCRKIEDVNTMLQTIERKTKYDFIRFCIDKVKGLAIKHLNNPDPAIREKGLIQFQYLKEPENYFQRFPLLKKLSVNEKLLKLHIEAVAMEKILLETYLTNLNSETIVEGTYDHFKEEAKKIIVADSMDELDYSDQEILNGLSI